MLGRVKLLNLKNGIGWITPDDGSPDYFFHKMLVDDGSAPIREGDHVNFERAPAYDENFAINIKKIEPGMMGMAPEYRRKTPFSEQNENREDAF